MILRSLNLLESGEAKFKDQEEKDATYAKKLASPSLELTGKYQQID